MGDARGEPHLFAANCCEGVPEHSEQYHLSQANPFHTRTCRRQHATVPSSVAKHRPFCHCFPWPAVSLPGKPTVFISVSRVGLRQVSRKPGRLILKCSLSLRRPRRQEATQIHSDEWLRHTAALLPAHETHERALCGRGERDTVRSPPKATKPAWPAASRKGLSPRVLLRAETRPYPHAPQPAPAGSQHEMPIRRCGQPHLAPQRRRQDGAQLSAGHRRGGRRRTHGGVLQRSCPGGLVNRPPVMCLSRAQL